jgi:ABC-type multidrug transport system ATPase subunit
VSVLSARKLSVRIGAAPVVRAVDLDLDAGAWCGLVGANGSGKTTLLRALAGRLQPDGGEIALFGERCEADPGRRAALIGMTPAAERLPKGLTPTELLRVLDLAADAPETDPTAEAIHRALGLDALARTPIGAMSAGQKQRVAIRCAFVGAPRLVLLDEPFNWLDPAVAHDVKAALRTITRERGVTVLSALHDTAVLAAWCDEGLLMADGKVAVRFDAADLAQARSDLAGFEASLVARLRRRP